MQLLFVHDFPVEKYKDNYYSIGFSHKIWNRYLTIFDKMLINSRVKNVDNGEIINKSNGEKVNFKTIDSYKSPKSLIFKHKKIFEALTISIKKSDGVLIRVPSVLGFIAALICKKLNKPYMVEVVGAAFDAYWFHGSIFGKILSLPMEYLQKNAVKNASIAIYVTKKYLSNKYPCNGKEFKGISNVQSVEKFNKNLDIGNKIKIGLIGSTFVDYKGHNVAIKSVSNLVNEGYNIELEFVGDGPSKKFMEMAKKYNVENNVIFKGKIYDKTELNNWFRNLDLYIQPSLTEGHCRAIVEAIGNGVPTLASNAGGNSDSVNKEYLFKPKDVVKLTKLINRSILSKQYREENVLENKKNISGYNLENIQIEREKALLNYKKIINDFYLAKGINKNA
ncbi:MULTISPECIES: glycosyltransferase [Staphylococcus]|uniref:glycosyltransferase n=1 Tax=Staphylococcus TaxID=1279 RepID=UPI001AEBADF5|nr:MULTISPECIES: glycosyltransferase family 4 protein [Staphylococcus]UXU52586.1 glycosyltransferase family 4 protein [Staphylococcus arlettae]